MRTLHWLTLCIVLLLAGCTTNEQQDAVGKEEDITNIKPDETITIPFHTPIDATSITDERVMLVHESGEAAERIVTLSDDRLELHISPPEQGFPVGHYTLTITSDVLTIGGQPLVASDYEKIYNVPMRYRVEQWVDGNIEIIGTFMSREEAEAVMTDETVLFDYDEAIVIPDGQGLVITTNQGITRLYRDDALTDAATYVAGSSELRLLEKTASYIKVLAANEVFYIEPDDVTYVPFYMERTHYTVEDGQLVFHVRHYRYDYTSSFAVSDAPSFLKEGKRYYSDDGHTFYDEEGEHVGDEPTYFQFLSMRSTTSYSAEQLDAYIVEMLEERQQQGGQYADAATKSKLLGLGTVLKKVEQELHVNALLILALAQHESDYGMSNHAQTYNNLFGLYVFDENPANKTFSSIEGNVLELAGQFLNKNYIPPGAGYAHGAYFGNKVQGVNVRYASDQFWGAKAAGHAYRIDRALGGKDFERYDNARVNDDILEQNNRLDVYAQKNDEQVIYTIEEAHGQFVTAHKSASGSWRAIISDSGRYDEGYVRKSVID